MRQTMEYAADKVNKPRPLFWQMAKVCLSSTGQVVHFPNGTYRKQMKTAVGRKEFQLMQRVFEAEWYVKRRASFGAVELFEHPEYERFEAWIQSDGWKIPIIESNAKQ